MEDPRKVIAIGSKNWVVSLCCGQVQSANAVIQKSKQILNNIHPKRKDTHSTAASICSINWIHPAHGKTITGKLARLSNFVG